MFTEHINYTHQAIVCTNGTDNFLLDDSMLWNYVKSSFQAKDIVITRFLGKTGNRIVQTGNGIILTFYLVRHFQVDDFRLLNFVSSSFLARDIVIIGFLG